MQTGRMRAAEKIASTPQTREKARVLYQSEGMTTPAIGKRLGVNGKTVASWVSRYGWAKDKQVMRDAVRDAVSTTSREQGVQRAKDVARFEERCVRDANSLRDKAMILLAGDEGDCVDGLKGLASVMQSVMSMTRTTLGLDKLAASTPGTLVNISLSGASLSAPIGAGNAARPIDVATVDTSESIPTS